MVKIFARWHLSLVSIWSLRSLRKKSSENATIIAMIRKPLSSDPRSDSDLWGITFSLSAIVLYSAVRYLKVKQFLSPLRICYFTCIETRLLCFRLFVCYIAQTSVRIWYLDVSWTIILNSLFETVLSSITILITAGQPCLVLRSQV